MNRREFVKVLVASGAGRLCVPSALAGEVPLFRVGIVTDTHVQKIPPDAKPSYRAFLEDSYVRVERAYELFKRHGVSLIANLGDISHDYHPDGYKRYADIRRATFPDADTAPKELYVWAGHDWRGHPERNEQKACEQAWQTVRKLLGIANERTDSLVFGGFRFLVFPQYVDYAHYERMIAEACRKSPERPVFVCEHVPAYDTTEDSVIWGDRRRREILSKFPQVITLTGHSHGSLRNERNIWQGEFTNVSAGCLAHWNAPLPGCSDETYRSWGCLVMEVYPNRAVFRRFDLQDRSEIGAGNPWTVSWPFDPKTAPYNPRVRAAHEKSPAFPSGSQLTLTTDDPSGFSDVRVSFPSAGPTDAVHFHRVELAKPDKGGDWVVFARCDVRADYHLRPKERHAVSSKRLSSAYFEGLKRCRITVTPVDFWGNAGQPLSKVWDVPRTARWKTVWAGVPAPAEAGRAFALGQPDLKFELPELPAAAVPKGVRLRIVADLKLKLDDPTPLRFALYGRMSGGFLFHLTPYGGDSDLRYAQEFESAGDTRYAFRTRYGGRGSVLFRTFRIEAR